MSTAASLLSWLFALDQVQSALLDREAPCGNGAASTSEFLLRVQVDDDFPCVQLEIGETLRALKLLLLLRRFLFLSPFRRHA